MTKASPEPERGSPVGFEGPEPREHSAATSSGPQQVYSVSLAEALTPGPDGKIDFSKFADFANDCRVNLQLGRAVTFDAYNMLFEGRRVEVPGNVPGTEIAIPPVNVLSNYEFNRMRARISAPQDEGDLRDLIRVAAHYEPSTRVIEMRLRQAKDAELPESIELSAGEMKLIFGILYHEMRHGAGEAEFLAYLLEQRALREMNAPGQRLRPLEIMEHIDRCYDPTPAADAQDEFQNCVGDDEFPEVTQKEYSAWMTKVAEQIERCGDRLPVDIEVMLLDEFDLDPDDYL